MAFNIEMQFREKAVIEWGNFELESLAGMIGTH